jgi:hypothetical protein
MRDKPKSPQYAIRAERREMLPTTPVHAAHAHDAQHDARHDAAHILRLTIPQHEYSCLIALTQKMPPMKKNSDSSLKIEKYVKNPFQIQFQYPDNVTDIPVNIRHTNSLF